MTLVILAAGMGSRFGGLKQIEPVDEQGNFIIDYSVYDAKCAGFDKIVFVIKKENYEVFKNTIGARIGDFIKVEYAFQSNDNLEKYVDIPKDRIKPFGTAHALLCAKEYIDGPFGIISSDDFYGRGTFEALANSLKDNNPCAIGYKLCNTMSENGSVKRGVCFNSNGYLTGNDDYKIEKKNNKIIGQSLVTDEIIELDEDQEVSMLMYGLNLDVLNYLEDNLSKFFEVNKDNLDTCEYLLPNELTNMIKDNKISIKLIKTDERWMGITYKEDLEKLKSYLESLRNNGLYPENLYK